MHSARHSPPIPACTPQPTGRAPSLPTRPWTLQRRLMATAGGRDELLSSTGGSFVTLLLLSHAGASPSSFCIVVPPHATPRGQRCDMCQRARVPLRARRRHPGFAGPAAGVRQEPGAGATMSGDTFGFEGSAPRDAATGLNPLRWQEPTAPPAGRELAPGCWERGCCGRRWFRIEILRRDTRMDARTDGWRFPCLPALPWGGVTTSPPSFPSDPSSPKPRGDAAQLPGAQ